MQVGMIFRREKHMIDLRNRKRYTRLKKMESSIACLNAVQNKSQITEILLSRRSSPVLLRSYSQTFVPFPRRLKFADVHDSHFARKLLKKLHKTALPEMQLITGSTNTFCTVNE